MRKSTLFVLAIFFAANVFGQYTQNQTMGTANTLVSVPANGGLRAALINRTFTDTTAANSHPIKTYPFAQIATTGDGNMWVRNYLATGWVLLGGGTSPSGTFWKVGGNMFPVSAPTRDIGTDATYGGAVGLMTNGVVRAIVPNGGFVLDNDTTSNKIFTWNPSTKDWGYANWNNGGGGGATPTLQQVLTAGSTLTVSNSIDAGGFNFNLRQVDTLSNAATIKEDSLTRYIMVTPNYESSFRIRDNGVDALIVDIGDVEDSGNGTNVALSDATGIIQLQAQLGGVILDGGYTKILNLANATTQDVLIGQTNIGDELGYITIGSGLSLSSGVLSASGGGSGITVGTTTITSGTNTRVGFNDGGVYGEDAGLAYDKTTDILSIGVAANVPTIYGGTGTTSDLNLKTTTGVGTTGADMHFLVGNNGGTEAMTILNSGNVGIGVATPSYKLHVEAATGATTTPFYVNDSEDNTGYVAQFGKAGVLKAAIGTEGNIYMVDMSAPSTPSSGYGTIYVRTDSLRFKNDAGTEFTLGSGGGGGSGITVGTTAIASGTAGRVLFQGSGNVLQQEAEFFWNETNNALQIGSPTAVSGYGMLLRQSDNGTTTGVRVISNNQTAYMDVYYAGLLHLGDLLLQGNTSIRLNTATGVTIGANSAPGATLDIRGRTMTNSRVLLSQGADVASAAGAITLGGDGNSFEITGTSSITAIVNTNWQNGATITLMFTSTATLTDGTANSGTSIGFELAGNTDFTATADDVITLVLSEIGGTQRWREKCRSVN